MVTSDSYKEWRVLTPMLLAIIIVAGAIIGYLGIDKLNAMTDMGKNTYALIGQVRNDLSDYKVESSSHFARIDQELLDFKPR